ncbi:class I SAM-dependent methyltransferase [Sediminibacterium sp.]|uniref:class I SAM-dependent methyltransferase n=1 Tax=Sediminibacterium sp. TaxID=1917865 RepID=UPI0025DF8DD6|nr:class I SAM-dependent methyltransferase [Sediminibacterium sp.]MBW0177704.1 class I SAM-dependent methyltransferase [Sediminibacterium sp.]
MEIEKLLKDNPSFHVWGDGRPANFGVSDKVVKYIISKLKPGFATLETGSGKSTFAFLMAGCKHISIAPDAGEGERIRQYCLANNLNADFSFIAESSAEVLPALMKTIPALDVVFIDGAHRYPYAEIDYHFTEQKLRVGGYMIVDDVHLPSVRNLFVFLKREKNWKLEAVIGKTAFFIKTGEEVLINDWQNQGINSFFLVYSDFKASVIKLIKTVLFMKNRD